MDANFFLVLTVAFFLMIGSDFFLEIMGVDFTEGDPFAGGGGLLEGGKLEVLEVGLFTVGGGGLLEGGKLEVLEVGLFTVGGGGLLEGGIVFGGLCGASLSGESGLLDEFPNSSCSSSLSSSICD